MTFQEALRHLKQRKFSPLYLITGDEPFLIDTLRTQFLSQGIEAAAKGFNLNQFRGGETTAHAIVSIANTFPMMSPRRMLIIQNAEQLKDERGLLLDYIAKPAETSIVIFIAGKPDMRKKFFSTLKKKASYITCPRPKERELPLWIRTEAKKLGLTLSEEALWFLKEHLGSNLLAIHQELEKLSLYHDKEGQSAQVLPLDVVQKVIGNGRSHSIFELTHAVGRKDCKSAIEVLGKMLSEGAHPLFILTMLVRLWRQMAIAKHLIDTGQARDVARKVPMPPRLLSIFLQQLKAWSKEEIQTAFEKALSADSQLKGGALSAKAVMENLVLDLCLSGGGVVHRGYSLPFLDQQA